MPREEAAVVKIGEMDKALLYGLLSRAEQFEMEFNIWLHLHTRSGDPSFGLTPIGRHGYESMILNPSEIMTSYQKETLACLNKQYALCHIAFLYHCDIFEDRASMPGDQGCISINQENGLIQINPMVPWFIPKYKLPRACSFLLPLYYAFGFLATTHHNMQF